MPDAANLPDRIWRTADSELTGEGDVILYHSKIDELIQSFCDFTATSHPSLYKEFVSLLLALKREEVGEPRNVNDL